RSRRRNGPDAGHIAEIDDAAHAATGGTTVSEETETVTESAGQAEADLVKRLEEEGEIAADYLEELLDIADLDGDIDIDVDHGRAAVEVVSEETGSRWLKRLVGKDGEVLDALQELT